MKVASTGHGASMIVNWKDKGVVGEQTSNSPRQKNILTTITNSAGSSIFSVVEGTMLFGRVLRGSKGVGNIHSTTKQTSRFPF